MSWIRAPITPSQCDSAPIKELRQLKYLTGVDVEFKEERDREPGDAADREKGRKMWKRELVNLLKDSPSPERKFLRWKIIQSRFPTNGGYGWSHEVVENEGLEVLL